MNLDREKKKVTLLKMQAARADMNLKVLEKLAEIERIKTSLTSQDEHIAALQLELSGE